MDLFGIIKMEKWYGCIECKQMTNGMTITLRNKYLVCPNSKLESSCYRMKKYTNFSKNELRQEHQALQ